jgi:hypothetical protein
LGPAIIALWARDNANAIRTSSPRWFDTTLYDARSDLLLFRLLFRRFSSLGLVRLSGLGCAQPFSLVLNLARRLFLNAALLVFNCLLLRFLAKPGIFNVPLTLFDVFPLARL